MTHKIGTKLLPTRPHCTPLPAPADGSSVQVLEKLWQMVVRDPGLARDATLLLPGLGLGCGTMDLGQCAPIDGVG